ncbi:MAG: hypothetical protein HC813_03690 [Planctomycetes bacterium]|nr:hypothetical protein [Planctomycetota bacterium]
MRYPILVFLALLCALSAAMAEESDGARLDRVERENAELRSRISALEEGQSGIETAIEGLLAEEEGLGLNMVARTGEVRAMLQVFGDVGFDWAERPPSERAHSRFFLGGLNLFFTAQVGQHFSVLSETVFKVSVGGDHDSHEFDQERLSIQWTFSDLLYLKLGLDHGPVSRWNNLYHHGRWLETTIDRPMLARFEGSGGFLPMHNSGLEAGGRLHPSFGTLQYVIILSNGRGSEATDPQKFSDRNDGKAIEFGLQLAPNCMEGVRFGIHFRLDDIPPIPSDPLRARTIRERIASAFFQFQGEHLEILAEVVFLENDDRTSGMTYGAASGYIQIAYRVHPDWLPYLRFDVREMEMGDPYFMPLGRDLDRWEQLFGVRYDAAANIAIKLEFGFGRGEVRGESDVITNESFFRVGLQVAWVF